ncbi:Transcriptional regulator, LysR family [Cupriavidus necator H850]|nr:MULTISPECIES: LysR family transcriptional regulator [Cupriavidus]KAI3596904.1 Transcriptional regulator, LysR family [Cupriavidus necator H850]MDX6008914.1 LysR family transcriptional regulator [Cupriavidus necator]QUN26072.1 LysR family transcriptional regulator [Cupriavidus sp. KK10]
MHDPRLDPVLLQSFVAVAESGSFTRAAQRVHLTQSTVSQQVRRLEDQLGCVLLDRGGRYVTTTPEGERLLGYARRLQQLMAEAVGQLRQSAGQGEIRIGVPEDFAARPLTPVLAGFADDWPGMRLEVTSGMSHELWQRFQDRELDLVLVKQRVGQAPGLASWPEPLCWFDSRGRPAVARDPVPLVAFPVGGLYRGEMTHALDAGGRRWRVAFVSASLASILAAVADGLGVTLLPRRLATAQHQVLEDDGWPAAVPDVELSLHAQPDLPAAARDMAARLAALCETVMGPGEPPADQPKNSL